MFEFTRMNRTIIKAFVVFILCLTCKIGWAQKTNNSNEVIYHVFLRSFYDSNEDNIGDLKGLQQKLAYLQDLGITSLLLTPINSSVFYHNYFSDDFEKIDPEFGTLQDYVSLVKEVHRRGMKIYLDMETQYVTEDHVWWKDSYNNLHSKYNNYILYTDSAHRQPSTIIFDLSGLTGYNNITRRITTVNLKSPDVLAYNIKLFGYFVDPDQNGSFDDGADGFRLDHAMDSLDYKPQLGSLFKTFWKPLITTLKQKNPNLIFTAEQANWADFGTAYFEEAGVDRTFAFQLQSAIASFDKRKLVSAIDSTLAHTPPEKQQVIFIENHDMKRFASAVNNHPSKLKIGATLNLLLGQVPSIYYGQELGMFGAGGFGRFNNTDANDIPMREAFEWYAADSGKGMATWYKNTGPWWDSTNLVPNDGISLEEEKRDPHSIYHFYKTLLNLRRNYTALQTGSYTAIRNNNDNVFSFSRRDANDRIVVVINLSAMQQTVTVDDLPGASQLKMLYATSGAKTMNGKLEPYEIEIMELKH
jgi:glycosidase